MDVIPAVHATGSSGVPLPSRCTPRELQAQVVNAVVAGDGLTRVAELTASAAGGPVMIVAPQLGGPWVGPRDHLAADRRRALELALIDRVRDPNGAPPGELAREVPIASSRIKGAVALLRSGQPVRPLALEYLQVAAAAALTEWALTEAGSAEYGMRGSLLSDLRGRGGVRREQAIRRIALLGCARNTGAVAICARVESQRSEQVGAMIASECPDAAGELVDSAIPDDDTRSLYALLPSVEVERHEGIGEAAAATLAVARRLGARIGCHGTVGLSSYCAEPAGLPCAIQEAELMLEILLRLGAPAAWEIGAKSTYRLLLGLLCSRPEELLLLYRETVAPLVAYDERHRTQLLRTLETYVARNCNMNMTASAMLAHRHTIAYRLERIRELTDLDPARPEDREPLGLGLKAHRLVNLQRGGRGAPASGE